MLFIPLITKSPLIFDYSAITNVFDFYDAVNSKLPLYDEKFYPR